MAANQKIVVLEDDSSSAKAFLRILKVLFGGNVILEELEPGDSIVIEGFDLFWATSVAQARNIIAREGEVDLLLSDDVVLGGERGSVLMQEMAGKTTVAWISADRFPEEFGARGILDLRKPASMDDIQKVCEKAGLIEAQVE